MEILGLSKTTDANNWIQLDKGGLLGPKKDKYKVCSLLDKAPPNFGSRQLKTANSARLLDIKTEVRA